MFTLYIVFIAFVILSLHFVGTGNRKAFDFTGSIAVVLASILLMTAMVGGW